MNLQPSGPIQSPVLSPREKQCVQLLAKGYRTQQIAAQLLLKEVTVHLYIRNARKKLNANTRAHLAVIAVMDHHIEI